MPPLKTTKFHRAMNKARARRFSDNTDDRYQAELPKRAGTVLAGKRQVKVSGQVYRLVNPVNLNLVVGNAITVENRGSPADATFQPAVRGV